MLKMNIVGEKLEKPFLLQKSRINHGCDSRCKSFASSKVVDYTLDNYVFIELL